MNVAIQRACAISEPFVYGTRIWDFAILLRRPADQGVGSPQDMARSAERHFLRKSRFLQQKLGRWKDWIFFAARVRCIMAA